MKTIAFIPGKMNDARVFHSLIDLLPEYITIVFEFPQGDTIESMARDICNRINQLKEVPVLIGHSMGGYITSYIAVNSPEHLKGWGLLASNAHVYTDYERTQRKKMLQFVLSSDENFKMFLEATPAVSLSPTSLHTHPEWKQLIVDMLMVGGKKRLVKEEHAILSKPDMRSELGFYNDPVLVVYGLKDKISPAVYAEQLNEILPNGIFHSLEKVSHMPMMESPKKVAQWIKDYMTIVE